MNKEYQHMLIDARNTVYRAVYAGLGDENKEDIDHTVIFFRFIGHYMNRFHPKSVHLFWDSPKDKLWRKKIYPEYKDGRDVSKGGKYEDVNKYLDRSTTILQELAPYINFRNYIGKGQEADDMIFAFCRSKPGSKLIISSDSDFKQIPFLYKDIDLFSPMSKTNEVYPIDDVDPVEIKSFMGDKRSDNIDGYPKIGDVRARQLVLDSEKRDEFFKIYGTERYLRNRALIDLNLCPFLLRNIMVIDEVTRQKVSYDIKNVYNIIQKYKVKGLADEINRITFLFKSLT